METHSEPSNLNLMSEEKSKVTKKRAFIVFLFLVSTTFLVDRFFFGTIYFLFPNEMEWDSSHWYNFLYKTKELKSNPKPNRVILTGSSVALYSALPEVLSKGLGSDMDVQFYSHVAMAPTDLYYYREDLIETNPSLVVYFLNFADLQWEYLTPNTHEFVFNERKWVEEFAGRYPAKTFYPSLFLYEYYPKLTKKILSNLSMKSMFLVSRYRNFFWDPIEVYIDNHFRSGRKYHLYQGQIPIEGIWSKGFTRMEATISCPNVKDTESIYIERSKTKVLFEFYTSDRNELQKITDKEVVFESSGWQYLNLKELAGGIVFDTLKLSMVDLDVLPSAKEVNLIRVGKDEKVGVRLSHSFCKFRETKNLSYQRIPYYDESRITNYSSLDYDIDYNDRMVRDAETRPELYRLNHVRKSKQLVNQFPYRPFPEMERIKSLSKYFESKKIPFVIILSPENPLEYKYYKDSKWKSDWILDLRNTLEKNNQVLFDHIDAVSEKRFFFDPHHLTFDGAMNYQGQILSVLKSQLKMNTAKSN
ncbi:MAG: hypothetical protein O9301_10390 [Leptospira sp.]|nr:hypothetical protein [Leptospira sp.]